MNWGGDGVGGVLGNKSCMRTIFKRLTLNGALDRSVVSLMGD